jgi:hypothetical protein
MDRYEGTLEDTELLEQRQIYMSGFYVEKERIHKILTCTADTHPIQHSLLCLC